MRKSIVGAKQIKTDITVKNTKEVVPELKEINQGDIDCRHNWKIGSQDGPVSVGECRLCGASKEFLSFIPAESLKINRRNR